MIASFGWLRLQRRVDDDGYIGIYSKITDNNLKFLWDSVILENN